MPTLGTASLVTGVVSMVLLTAVVVLGVLVNRQGRLPGLAHSALAGLRVLAGCAGTQHRLQL